MDNVTGNNKNWFVCCFWSLLVAKGIFKEVYVNFMLVRHTHNDIYALFGRWSISLWKENFPIIPLLIEEVPNFKGFISGFIAEGDEALKGYTKA
jgi:hypothetical protein